MSERRSWTEIKLTRAVTQARQAGYAEARDGFELGARVRAERERLALTQAELAERMGCTQPTLAHLVAGGVAPTIETLHRVAEALTWSFSSSFVDLHPPRAGQQ